MDKKIFNVIDKIIDGSNRIDKFLQSKLNTISRTRIQDLIRNGHVKVNDVIILDKVISASGTTPPYSPE